MDLLIKIEEVDGDIPLAISYGGRPDPCWLYGALYGVVGLTIRPGNSLDAYRREAVVLICAHALILGASVAPVKR